MIPCTQPAARMPAQFTSVNAHTNPSVVRAVLNGERVTQGTNEPRYPTAPVAMAALPTHTDTQ